jgi:hypothetical protein
MLTIYILVGCIVLVLALVGLVEWMRRTIKRRWNANCDLLEAEFAHLRTTHPHLFDRHMR